ncbi:type II secretion system F family protein [Frankia sp. Cas4]|uniref:type II secretion system F family protein n=1 Tax=Frankia sp. Cas4 TaxID=3073927 RepID=UPI002AD1DADA|nr:type II secretion system F family protein [Frankia sp. Cas4]
MLMLMLATVCAATAAALASGPIGRRPPHVRVATTRPPATRRSGRDVNDLPEPPAARTWAPPAIVAAAAALSGACFGPVVACVTVVGAVTAQRAMRRAAARRWHDAQRADAQEVLAALATELEAGRSPSQALRTAVEDLGNETDRPRFGQSPPRRGTRVSDSRALRTGLAHRLDPAATLERCQAPTLRQLAAAWRVSQIAGIPLAPMASRLAAVVRAEQEKDGEVSAALAGPRASGRLIAALPLAGIGLGILIGASPLDVLLGTPVGTICLAVGAMLDLAGLAWINRLTETARSRGETGRYRYDAQPMVAVAL